MKFPKVRLEKLKIHAYKDDNRSEKTGTFDAMFNPETYSENYTNEFAISNSINNPGTADYITTPPQDLTLDLLLDGSEIYESLGIKLKKNVKAMVDEFLKLTLLVIGATHQPAFLKIEWGALIFNCRLKSVDILYTLFNRNGEPLRAILKTTFVAELKKSLKSSPDLTHKKSVGSGDNLPLLTYEIYQNPLLYIQIARTNELDNFRSLEPGTNIIFPPVHNE